MEGKLRVVFDIYCSILWNVNIHVMLYQKKKKMGIRGLTCEISGKLFFFTRLIT